MLFYIFHLLPALAIDCFHSFRENPNMVNTKRTRVYQKYTSVREYCESLTIQTMTSQKYQENNTQALWRSLSLSDRTTFNFNVSQLDWDEYLYTLARGVRLYCLGDSLDTIPRAANRMNKLKLLHYGCVGMVSFTVLMVTRVILKFVLF
uniref:Fatty acyl-CoA reductase C-terminal domain-containing protein n=2 Tax=Graphocephala atropunctata TaxID=36148 RepID=A0A1B6LK03_9HEMI